MSWPVLCDRAGGKFTTPVTKGPLLESSPRTPTPFKHALADAERRAKAKEWVCNHAGTQDVISFSVPFVC